MKKMYLNRQKRIFLNGGRRNIYNRKKRSISPTAIGVVLAFLLLIGTILYSAADVYNKKKLVNTYLSNAHSYTEAQNYSAAAEEYNKALKIGLSSGKPEIYRGMVYCYIKDNKTDEAVDYVKLLLARRELSGENFSEIALMINSVDPSSAYRLLQTYIEKCKADDPAVKKLVASSESAPAMPVLDMLPGSYVKLTDIKFKPDDEHFGHSIYYTTNNETPDEYSKIYRGGFPIEDSTDLRAVSYNSKAECSDIAVYSFNIDTEMLEKLKSLTADVDELIKGTDVGPEIGQCSKAAKQRLTASVDESKALLERNNILFMDAENNVDYLNAAKEEFISRINKTVDKETLDKLIIFADEIYLAVGRASIANNVSDELDSLKTAIDNAKAAQTPFSENSGSVAYHALYQSLLDLNFAGYKAAYKALLISNDCNNYIIYDVNGDMIPELILNRGTNNENYFYTYSVEQGETVRVDTDENFTGIKRFYMHHDGILGCTSEDGSDGFRLITFVKNKLEISDVIEQYSTSETLRTSLVPVQVNLPSNIKQIDEY